MTQLDQFESVFKAASRTVYHYQPTHLRRALVVSDLEAGELSDYGARVRGFVGGLDSAAGIAWESADASAFGTVGDLLQLVERIAPDLICTYRNLKTNAWRWPYTLGDHLEVLTQATAVPILVTPRPDAPEFAEALTQPRRVMAVTDHLTGDDRLVNYAVALTSPGGTLILTHVEDQAIFERYLDIISKLPQIDTASAAEAIRGRLLREPADYIASCQRELAAQGLALQVEQLVTLGHRLAQFNRLVREQRVDLLVLNTKDEDQLAMHGLAYPLAIELRQLPLLML